MKSFKQFDESHSVALNSAEDDNLVLLMYKMKEYNKD